MSGFFDERSEQARVLAPLALPLGDKGDALLAKNPALIEEGKNPFSLDSKEPNWANFHDFLMGEVRYLSVKKAYPNEAEELFAEAQKMAQLRYKTYIRKSQENWED